MNDFPQMPRFSLMFAITHTRRIPRLSKIGIRDRRRRHLFVSYSSSLSLIYPSMLLEDTISAVRRKVNEMRSRKPKSIPEN